MEKIKLYINNDKVHGIISKIPEARECVKETVTALQSLGITPTVDKVRDFILLKAKPQINQVQAEAEQQKEQTPSEWLRHNIDKEAANRIALIEAAFDRIGNKSAFVQTSRYLYINPNTFDVGITKELKTELENDSTVYVNPEHIERYKDAENIVKVLKDFEDKHNIRIDFQRLFVRDYRFEGTARVGSFDWTLNKGGFYFGGFYPKIDGVQ